MMDLRTGLGPPTAAVVPFTPSEADGTKVPTGTIAMWPRETAPDGWLLLDGSTYDNSDYPNLSFFPGSGTTVEQQKILASDAQAGDQFGAGVAISGDTAVVGAFTEDVGGADAGAAYVFARTAGVWTEQQKIVASDPSASAYFGESVGIDGDTLVVGAENARTGGIIVGAAYVFTRTAGVWTEQQKLVASDAQQFDQFGAGVAISGDTIVVGAPGEDAGGAEAGAAYVFTRTAGVWTEQQKIVASDAQAGDDFGVNVSVSGDTVAVGASLEDAGGADAGAAYVFTRTAGVWTEQQKIVASDAQAGDHFGNDVSLYADSVVVGSCFEDAGGADAGAAYVFTRTAGVWTQQQKIVASDAQAGDHFGISVSISGDTIVVGAPGEDAGGADAGAAYVFTRTAGVWTQQQKIVASDAQAGDNFGLGLAIDYGTIIVGAYLEDAGGGGAGAIYVFKPNSFQVPDMRQRFPLGRAASGTGSTLLGNGGSFTTGAPSATVLATAIIGGAASPTHTHLATPPFLALNFIIKT